jgi:hypothetical protein
MDTFSYTSEGIKKLQSSRNNFFSSLFWAFPAGRAMRCNLFSLEEREKRISTSIPNAVYGNHNPLFFINVLYLNSTVFLQTPSQFETLTQFY